MLLLLASTPPYPYLSIHTCILPTTCLCSTVLYAHVPVFTSVFSPGGLTRVFFPLTHEGPSWVRIVTHIGPWQFCYFVLFKQATSPRVPRIGRHWPAFCLLTHSWRHLNSLSIQHHCPLSVGLFGGLCLGRYPTGCPATVKFMWISTHRLTCSNPSGLPPCLAPLRPTTE